MDMSFFSLLLLWGRGMAARSIGSPSAAARAARFRWLYRKQYFTPTMIHRFVKTTPNPRATKNSSGELVGPLPEPLPELFDDEAGGGWAKTLVGEDIIACCVPYVQGDGGEGGEDVGWSLS